MAIPGIPPKTAERSARWCITWPRCTLLEIELAQTGSPQAIRWPASPGMRPRDQPRGTPAEYDAVSKGAALESADATARRRPRPIRAFSDGEPDPAAPVSLNSADAPLTCQFMLEDHAVRHSYHHLARIRAALQSSQCAELVAVHPFRPAHPGRRAGCLTEVVPAFTLVPAVLHN